VFSRSSSDRVLTGVAGGIGERLGIDPLVVRLAFVVLSLAGGVGVLLYVAGALVSRGPDPDAQLQSPLRTGARQGIAVGMVVAGILLLLRSAGLWFGDGVVWPAALAILGSAVIWTRGDDADRARWGSLMSRVPGHLSDAASGRGARIRLSLGAVLIVLGLTTFLTSNSQLAIAGNAPLAVVAALTGAGVILGPWGVASGPTARRGAAGADPTGGASRDGCAPARLGAPDAGADRASRGPGRDANPRPRTGA